MQSHWLNWPQNDLSPRGLENGRATNKKVQPRVLVTQHDFLGLKIKRIFISELLDQTFSQTPLVNNNNFEAREAPFDLPMPPEPGGNA